MFVCEQVVSVADLLLVGRAFGHRSLIQSLLVNFEEVKFRRLRLSSLMLRESLIQLQIFGLQRALSRLGHRRG